MPAIIIEAIGQLFDEKMEKQNKKLDDRLNHMKLDIIEQIRKDTDEILKTALDKFKNEYITAREEKIEQLTNSQSTNEILVGKLERKICDLEVIVDEQINRNLCNNIIVKDIPEVEDEKWSNTKDIVATSFSNILDKYFKTIGIRWY